VTASMRAAISCTTMRAIVVGISVQSRVQPYFAPACEYVRMPPGSFVHVGGDESRPQDHRQRDQTIGQDAEGRRRQAPPQVFRLRLRSHYSDARTTGSGRSRASAQVRQRPIQVRAHGECAGRTGDAKVPVGLAGGNEKGRFHWLATVFTQNTAAVSHLWLSFSRGFGAAPATPSLPYNEGRRRVNRGPGI